MLLKKILRKYYLACHTFLFPKHFLKYRNFRRIIMNFIGINLIF
jgi:hypothetical protein